jgi:hypothetical protein
METKVLSTGQEKKIAALVRFRGNVYSQVE